MVDYSQGGFGASIDLGEMTSAAGDGALVFDASGVPTFLASGNALEVLRVNSGGTALEFGAGILTKIAESALGAAANSVSFASIPTGFNAFLVVVDADMNSTDTGRIDLRLNNDSGNNYEYSGSDCESTQARNQTTAAAQISFNVDTHGFNAEQKAFILISNNDAALEKQVFGSARNGNVSIFTAGAWTNTADEISRIDLSCNFGTGAKQFAAGSRFILYGMGD